MPAETGASSVDSMKPACTFETDDGGLFRKAILFCDMTAAFPTANVFRSFAVSVLILGTAALFSACASPGDNRSDTFSAEPFGVLDSPSGESWISINGEGSRMLFGRQGEDLGDYVIFESVRSGRTWGEPVQTSFSGSGSDRGARFYPALDAVVFSSNRAVAPGDSTADFDLWITQFDGEEWSSPEPMSPLNTDANEMHPSVATDGTIWFSSDRDGSFGQSDLWYAELGSTGYEVRQAPEPLNSEFAETDAFIDPAGRYIIFSGRSGRRGRRRSVPVLAKRSDVVRPGESRGCGQHAG